VNTDNKAEIYKDKYVVITIFSYLDS